MSELSVNHLLGIKHLTAEDIQLILDTAKDRWTNIFWPIWRNINVIHFISCVRPSSVGNSQFNTFPTWSIPCNIWI